MTDIPTGHYVAPDTYDAEADRQILDRADLNAPTRVLVWRRFRRHRLGVFCAMFLAVLVGFRHALEPDHLAAVSTLVSQRRGTWRCAAVGATWGLGHAVGIAAFASIAGDASLRDR